MKLVLQIAGGLVLAFVIIGGSIGGYYWYQDYQTNQKKKAFYAYIEGCMARVPEGTSVTELRLERSKCEVGYAMEQAGMKVPSHK